MGKVLATKEFTGPDALKELKRALRKRKKVQSTKQIPDEYIWSLLEKDSQNGFLKSHGAA